MFAVDDVVGAGTTGHREKEFLFLRGELLTKNLATPSSLMMQDTQFIFQVLTWLDGCQKVVPALYEKLRHKVVSKLYASTRISTICTINISLLVITQTLLSQH